MKELCFNMTAIELVKIERVSPKKNKIFFSNGYSVEIDVNLFLECGLNNKKIFDSAEFDLLKNKIQNVLAEKILIQKLNGRKRSEFEIKNELLNNGISADIIEVAVEKYRHLGYINDFDFAYSFIKDKINFGR